MLKYQRRLINSKIIAETTGIDPNPAVNSGNSTVSYIKVTTSSSIIKVN